MLNLLGLTADDDEELSPNPFAVAAHQAPSPPAVEASAERLAFGMSRLAMRTLSLKRQCSREDPSMDALDQALMLEVGGPGSRRRRCSHSGCCCLSASAVRSTTGAQHPMLQCGVCCFASRA